jgi:MarR family multiple antibiotic resistance transcriptional regulator
MSTSAALGLPSGEYYAMTNLVRTRDRQLSARLAFLGLTLPEWRALRVLCSFGTDIPMSALIAHSQNDRSALGRTVDRLVDRGLVERMPDPQDKRAVYLRRRPAANEIFERAFVLAAELDEKLMAPLSNSERQTLGRSLEKLEGIVGKDV